MGKMRVFELARELNLPGKDLIQQMQGLGFRVDGNFNVLDDQEVADIKSKLADPKKAPVLKKRKVVKADAEPAAEPADASTEEVEAEEAPRRRRVISARRTKTSGADADERSKPTLRKSRTAEEEAEPEAPPVEEIAAEAVTPELEITPAPEEEPTAERPEAADVSEVPEAAAQPEEIQPPPPSAQPVVSEQSERAAKAKREPEPEQEDDGLKRASKGTIEAKLKDWQDEKGKWREVKKPERKHQARLQGDGWVRPPRRKGDKRAGKGLRAKSGGKQKHIFEPRKKAIRIGNALTVSELAGATGIKGSQIIKKLFDLGITASINEYIDGHTAELIASEYDIQIEVDTSNLEDLVSEESADSSLPEPRPPIVTIMGHVDHGKTSLLDFIRKSKIATGEAGGITQHIGAYYVRDELGDLVFLDTPGHEAFTSLRARGADVTDIVILVVAADDGIMPQTVEAIEHARAADVPIIVAANKMDRPNADLDKIKRQLMEHDLLAEEFGGEVVVVPVSAQTGDGIDQLLEMVRLQTELMELKSTTGGNARGYVIESRMDRQRGPVATVLVRRGTLSVGDDFVAGQTYGRVRALFDDRGNNIQSAGPSVPVEVLGYDELPQAGNIFAVMADEKVSRQIAQQRANQNRGKDSGTSRQVTLQDFLEGIAADEVRNLNIVLKADTQGSLEALRGSLEKQGNEQVRVNFVRAGVGGITETDVSLAGTSRAVVLGFNVRPEANAELLSRSDGVEIKSYTVIYDLINDIHDSLEGMLKPIEREEIIGHCEVRQVFAGAKEVKIAGGYITDGHIERKSTVRLYRDDVVIHTGPIETLRRFKDDVSDVQTGYECGVRIENFNDLREGDLIEAFIVIEENAKLERAER